MSLPGIAIRKPVLAWMLMAALVLFGGLSFHQMGISPLPDVDLPVVSVTLSLPGATPDTVEAQVTDPIEDALMQIEGVREISSTSSQGSASILLEFELGRNIDLAIREVQNRVAQLRDRLPRTMDPPIAKKSNPEDQPLLWVILTADSAIPPMDVMSYAHNRLYGQFASLDGVSDVVLGGYSDPALRISVNGSGLERYHLTSRDLIRAITEEHVEIPAGRVQNKKTELNVRVLGEAKSPEEFARLPITSRDGEPIYQPLTLGMFAKVEEGTAEVRKISRFNGKRAIGLGVLKRRGANAVEVADRAHARMEALKPSLPEGYGLAVAMDSTRNVRESIEELGLSLFLSAILASVVCLLFLASWRSTLNVILSIPTSIIGTFIALHFLGFTLNSFTLLGLSLAIGLVVDDSIMMIENIARHRESGLPPREAAAKGAAEITFAAVAATVAVAAIFLPVVFMKGVIGRYFLQYGVTVTVAVALSLLEALTLTPMRASRARAETPSRFSSRASAVFGLLSRGYAWLLEFSLLAPGLTLAAAAGVFLMSVLVARELPSELVPPQDESRILFKLWGPPGLALQATDAAFKKAEALLSSQPEIESLYSTVGGTGGDSVNQGSILVTLVPPHQRSRSQAALLVEFQGLLSKSLKEMRVVGQDLSRRGFGGGGGFPLELVIQGSDREMLSTLAQASAKTLMAGTFARDVRIEAQPETDEYRLVPDRDKLAGSGVSLESVTEALTSLVAGVSLKGQAEYPKDGHRYEIGYRLLAPQREQAEQLRTIRVRNNRGQTIPLSQVVEVRKERAEKAISRVNRVRSIRITANLAEGVAQEEAISLARETVEPTLPKGYFLTFSGGSRDFGESMRSLKIALALGVLVSYMVLASQLNSFIQPLSILLALPLGLSGAFVALALTGQSLNAYSMIGLILLMGIAKKNSILLVDTTNRLRESRGVERALIEACPLRLRPILMTSFATMAGALPAALSLGPGAETRVSMAIAIIGGVAASTVLSLFVVPCAYRVLAQLEISEGKLPVREGRTRNDSERCEPAPARA